MEILKNISGMDWAVRFSEEKSIKILQLTDMQMIDAEQRRYPDRLRADEIAAWQPERMDALCGDHIRSLIAQTSPDLIFITGDIVYGSFDDTGKTLRWFIDLMDSFEIPWLPVFGNHDNESNMGVTWQCEQFEKSPYCLFSRGSVSGNSNYTVGIFKGDRLVRVLHMLDSNGCHDASDASVIRTPGLYPDQLARMEEIDEIITKAYGYVPAFAAFHIPTEDFLLAETEKGYRQEGRELFVLGVDAEAKDHDFGAKLEAYCPIGTQGAFLKTARKCRINGVFVGHCHSINTCISYEGIRYVFGLKTGQYDYHNPGQLGGTLITLHEDSFSVSHVPSLSKLSPYPKGGRMFENYFV